MLGDEVLGRWIREFLTDDEVSEIESSSSVKSRQWFSRCLGVVGSGQAEGEHEAAEEEEGEEEVGDEETVGEELEGEIEEGGKRVRGGVAGGVKSCKGVVWFTQREIQGYNSTVSARTVAVRCDIGSSQRVSGVTLIRSLQT